MSHPLTILLKPRPTHEKYGTEWLPGGAFYGPFHPDYSPPADATEQHEIALSTNVIDQWTEFHTKILPLLTIPQMDNSIHPRELYAAWRRMYCGWRISKFLLSVILRVDKLQRDLVLGYDLKNEEIDVICEKLFVQDLFPLDARTIELKITIHMVSSVLGYLNFADAYEIGLQRRCTAWERLSVDSSSFLTSIQHRIFGIPDAGPFSVVESSTPASWARIEFDHVPDEPQRHRSGFVRRHPHKRASNEFT
ncbi:hypothetical protein B0H19DRAFT_1121592 [Mycena capillaripes]|nr:hypothetical protein B0H19DRAFT_1121592 [Mycena capillaripes]